MKVMRIIVVAVFTAATSIVLLAGILYPQVQNWSYLAAAVFGFHTILGLIVGSCKMADAGRIAAWSWHGISALLSLGMLLLRTLQVEEGWLIAAATLTAFTAIVTLVFCMILNPRITTDR
jgi:hypothetical protein